MKYQTGSRTTKCCSTNGEFEREAHFVAVIDLPISFLLWCATELIWFETSLDIIKKKKDEAHPTKWFTVFLFTAIHRGVNSIIYHLNSALIICNWWCCHVFVLFYICLTFLLGALIHIFHLKLFFFYLCFTAFVISVVLQMFYNFCHFSCYKLICCFILHKTWHFKEKFCVMLHPHQ